MKELKVSGELKFLPNFFFLVTSNIDYFSLLIGINSFRGGGGW